jgi:4a-hydroxytetrahydrobiopterin dehydratase
LPAFGPAFQCGQNPFTAGSRHAGEFRVIFWRMTDDLANRHCKPCEGGVRPLASSDAQALLATLHSAWRISDDGRKISREFTFPAYSRSLGFANAVAWIAITEGHHPDMLVSYGRCVVNYTTHAIGGLSDNDFICAAKVDRLITSDD